MLDAMFEKRTEPGEYLIRQGDDGDNFYVIENGMFDVLVTGDDRIEKVCTKHTIRTKIYVKTMSEGRFNTLLNTFIDVCSITAQANDLA